MSQFKYEELENTNQVIWTFSGFMNESFEIPFFNSKKTLVINLKGITGINSYGIKVWLKWSQQSELQSKVILEECPFVFIKNNSLIKGFVSEKMLVNSFYVPFFSHETEESKQVLLVNGSDFTYDGLLKLPKVLDSKGIEMELDANKDTFFSFLKRKNV